MANEGHGDQITKSANSNKAGDSRPNSSHENEDHIVEWFQFSLEKAKLMIQPEKMDYWKDIKTAKNSLNNHLDILFRERATGIVSLGDLNLMYEDVSRIINSLARIEESVSQDPDSIREDVERANLILRFYRLLNHEDAYWPGIQYNAMCIFKICFRHLSPEGKRTLIRRLIFSLHILRKEAFSTALSILREEVSRGGKSCDEILANGLVPQLLNLVKPEHTEDNIKNFFDFSSAICESEPLPNITAIIQLLPVLSSYIVHQEDRYFVEILQIITNITKGGQTYCQLVVDSGLLDEIMPLAFHRNIKSCYTAEVFRILENIATGSHTLKMALLDAGAMVVLRFAFLERNEIFLPRALSFLKNFVGNDCKLLQVVVDSDLFPVIVNSLQKGSDSQLLKETALTLTSFFMVAKENQLLKMNEHGAIRELCGLLESDEFALIAIKAIQAFTENCPEYGRRILDHKMRECNAYEKVRFQQEESEKRFQTLSKFYQNFIKNERLSNLE